MSDLADIRTSDQSEPLAGLDDGGVASNGSPGGTAASTSPPRPSLVINALSSWAGLGVNIIVGLLLVPFVVDQLGQTGYGIWTLVGSIIGYYGLLDLGVSSAVSRYVARYAGQKDYRALNSTVSTSLAMFSIVGLVIVGISLGAADLLGSFFNVSAQQMPNFRNVVYLLGAAAAVNMIGQVFRATITAHEFFVARNSVLIVTTLVRAGLTVWTLLNGLGLLGVAISYLVADMLALIVFIALTKIMTPQVKIRLAYFQWRRLGMVLAFGLTTTIIIATNIIRVNLDSAVIGKMISLEAVGVYGIAAILLQYFSRLLHSGLGVTTPRFAGLDGQNDLQSFRKLLVKALWVSSLLSCLVGLVLLVLGKQFIVLWVGPQYRQAGPVLMVLTLCYVIALAQTPAINALFATNKHKYLAIARVIEAACNLTLSIILARRLGIMGVALGTMIPNLIVTGLVQPIYMSRILGITARKYVFIIVLAIVPAAALYFLWQWMLADRILSIGYVGLCLSGVGITISYGVVMLVLVVLLSKVIQLTDIWPIRSFSPKEPGDAN